MSVRNTGEPSPPSDRSLIHTFEAAMASRSSEADGPPSSIPFIWDGSIVSATIRIAMNTIASRNAVIPRRSFGMTPP